MAKNKTPYKKNKTPYKLSFSTGGLLLTESVELARYRRRDEPWDDVIVRAIADAVAHGNKAATLRRSLREIVNRLSMLSMDELDYLIASDDRTEHQALLWLAACRAYRFVAEFAVQVVRERYLSYRLDLPIESFDIFWDEKAEWNAELNDISTSTRLKLRQVMFRMMREAAIITGDGTIQTAYLTPAVRTLIEQTKPTELLLFPGIQVEGAPA